MKVLLTGGTGFVAAHCLETLLQHGHDVVTTVRSHKKGQTMLNAYGGIPTNKLSYVVIEDIGASGAFNEAVRSSPPFEAVIHTASPFHFNTNDPEKDLLNPAVQGTTEILKAIKTNAPSVRRVVITSSLAAVLNFTVHEKSKENGLFGYIGSKKFAEKAAWDFMTEEKPNFTLTTINPPMIYGPIVHYLETLSAINTSNTIFRDFVEGKFKDGLPPTGPTPDWVDVRDVALAHVLAIETSAAGGRRFFVVAGQESNPAMAKVIYDHFPQLREKIPHKFEADSALDVYTVDNSPSKEILKLEYRPFGKCVISAVKSVLAFSG